jgi:hypothetical protein
LLNSERNNARKKSKGRKTGKKIVAQHDRRRGREALVFRDKDGARVIAFEASKKEKKTPATPYRALY